MKLTFKIEIEDKVIELTEEEARELYGILGKILGVPKQPYDLGFPTKYGVLPIEPYKITCNNTGDIIVSTDGEGR